MGRQRLGRQPDLFARDETSVSPETAAPCDPGGPASSAESSASAHEPPPPDFVARIRAELRDTLARARAADALPWPDLTRTTLAEMRFHSVASWLPPDEARSLRAAFAAEMDRLYARHDAGTAG